MKTNATRGLFIARHLFAEAKTIQNCKQSRIPCVFLHFFWLKINGAANKSEFLVQPKWSREGTDCCKSHAGSAVPKASTWMIRQGGVDKCRAKKFFDGGLLGGVA